MSRSGALPAVSSGGVGQQVYTQEMPPSVTGPALLITTDEAGNPLPPDQWEVQVGGVPSLAPTDVDAIQGLATGTGIYIGEANGVMGFEETTAAQVGKALVVQPDGSVLPETQAALQAGSALPVAFPGFMAPALGAGILVTANAALVGQNIRHLTRLIAPKAGAVRDLTIFAGATGAGQYIAALYDVGGITPGTYTKLWENPPVTAGNTVPQPFDPAATGTKFNGWDGNAAAYQHFAFMLVADSATTQTGRLNLGAAAYGLLSSTRGLVGGLQPKPFGTHATLGFSAPATFSEADLAVTDARAIAAYGWVA